MRKELLVAAAIIAGIFGLAAYNGLSNDGLFATAKPTREQIETALLESGKALDTGNFYPILKEKFPQDYQGFLDEMVATIETSGAVGDAANQIAFARAQAFTANVRQQNAHYLLSAPVDTLRDVGFAGNDLLKSMQNDPALCAQFALNGGESLSIAQAQSLDLGLMSAVSAKSFLAMAAGRDTPQTYDAATQEDVMASVARWQALPETPEAVYNALIGQNDTLSDICAAHISFTDFVMTDDSPQGINVLVFLSATAAGL